MRGIENSGETSKVSKSASVVQIKTSNIDVKFDSSCSASSLLNKTDGASRLQWDEEKEKEVKLVFQEEINNKVVTIAVVRRKISCNEVLREEDPKKSWIKSEDSGILCLTKRQKLSPFIFLLKRRL